MHRQIISQGRRAGKSTLNYSLEDAIARDLSEQWQQSLDQAIIDDLWIHPPKTYYIHKSWRDRRGRKMHRISYSGGVQEWLETTQSQQGNNNPEWWFFENQINITDRLLSMLILKFGKE